MVYRQIRIFVLPSEAIGNWVENVFGRVIGPTVALHPSSWYWFSRYGEGRQGSSGDCDLDAIPAAYIHSGEQPSWRSVRFRFAAADTVAPVLEVEALRAITAHSYAASGFIDYDWVGDMAATRILADPRSPERMRQRATLVAQFLHSTALIYADALQGPDASGQFYQEEIQGYQHGLGSCFEPLRHLIVDMVHAPTQVYATEQSQGLFQIRPHNLGEPQFVRDDANRRFTLFGFHQPFHP